MSDDQTRFMPLATATELARNLRVFEAWCGYAGGGLFTTEVDEGLTDSVLEFVTEPCFTLLGVRPLLGRVISDADALGAAPSPVAVLGHGFWQRHFGGDARVVGQTLRIDSVPFTVIGVTPPEFSGLRAVVAAEVFVPMTMLPTLFGTPAEPPRVNYVIGRLRDEVTLAQARAEVDARWPTVRGATVPAGLTPDEQQAFLSMGIQVEAIGKGFSFLRDTYTRPLAVLVGLAALLLGLACVQLSNLSLARDVERHHELAIRVALGAPRRRLVQPRVIEGLLLAAAGTALAVPLAWWVSTTLRMVMWRMMTVPTTPDRWVLGVMTVAAFGAGLAISLVPTLAVTRRSWAVPMHGTHAIGPGSRHWVRGLVVGQVAMSLALVFGAGLLGRSLARLRAVDPGFPTAPLLMADLSDQPTSDRVPDEVYFPRLFDRLAEVPGVEAVAFARLFPRLINETGLLQPVGVASTPDSQAAIGAAMEVVSPGFFDTVGIPVLSGRDVTWQDAEDRPGVAIVNVGLAERLFPSGNALGQRIRLGTDPGRRALEIIGVVGNTSLGNLRTTQVPIVFRPALQEARFVQSPTLTIRTGVDPASLGGAVSQAVTSAGGHYVRARAAVEAQLTTGLAQERIVATLSSLFAGLAVLMSRMRSPGAHVKSVYGWRSEHPDRPCCGWSCQTA